MTAPLPDARLAEIEAVEATATKGPWLQTDGWTVEGPRADDGCGLMVSIDVGDPADGAFIAMARDAVPELVAEVKRLRAEVERLTPAPKVIREPAARRAALLAAVVRQGGEWTPTRVERLYKQHGDHDIYRRVVRVDLAALHAAGHLVLHDDAGRRFYTPAKDGAE